MAETDTEISSVKALAESGFTSIPSPYVFKAIATADHHEIVAPEDQEDPIPIIDFALLTSDDPDQRSKVLHDLEKACRDWGVFMVINHGISESLMKETLDGCGGFFNMDEKDKKEFEGKHGLDSIMYGTSFNGSPVGKDVFLWRDFLKVIVHPNFHSISKPPGFSEVIEKYTTEVRKVARDLLAGISETLGLGTDYIEKAMNLESLFQIFAANLYPPCPQPEIAMGIPSHTDHGLLTILIYNGVGGLQVHYKGMWVNAEAAPGALLVNLADHLEILTNGKYKSCNHRAVVNNKTTRISIAVPNGPSLDTVVVPAPELVDSKNSPTIYKGITYKDFLDLQQNKKFKEKSGLDYLRISHGNIS